MKNIIYGLLFLLIAPSAFAVDAEFLGYLRGGTGLNLQGGHRECFFNNGLPGNFLRLGNECDVYTELAFLFHNKKATADDATFFRTQVRLMYHTSGTRQYEGTAVTVNSTPSTTTVPDGQIEAFVKGGGFGELPGEYWIGKRFYRDVNLYIFDWFYYADMSGVGAGVEELPVGPGRLAVAHLIQSNADLSTTSIGRPALNALDVRYTSIPTFADQKLNFWGVYAWAPGSSNGTTEYVGTNGFVLATKLEGTVMGGSNKVALEYGKGVMKDFNLYGSSAVDVADTSQNHAWNMRVVEDYTRDVTDKWALMLGLAANIGSNGKDSSDKTNFQEVGVRPIYYVTDRFQWAFEAGYSRYEDESETNGAREMSRLTVSPQLSINKSLWGRPVLRAYLSYSFWNDANQGAGNIGNSAPTFAAKSSGMNFGYQFESWF